MEVLIVVAVLAFIGVIVRLAMGGDPVTYPGRQLQEKFGSLGNMTGMARIDIERVAGPPNSISAIAGGRVLCQWMATGYHISILFKDDVFDGISHEFASGR